MAKIRADMLMVDQGLAETRSHARALIMAGKVLADGRRVDKAGEGLKDGTVLTVKGRVDYVSRGGYKLAGALDDFNLDVGGFAVLDVGASTGGFTDCLLQRGAAGVVAVDVGYGLIHWRLRNDPRVKVLEKTNARYLTAETAGSGFDLAVMDLSFISLSLVLPAVAPLVRPSGHILAMVKPQFEVGKNLVGHGGVVRDPEHQAEAVRAVAEAAVTCGCISEGAHPARIKGPKGNQEYFLFLSKSDS